MDAWAFRKSESGKNGRMTTIAFIAMILALALGVVVTEVAKQSKRHR